MAGKHQIFSSKKSTRQKANRSWRRKANERVKTVKSSKPNTVNPTLSNRRMKPLESTKQADEGFSNTPKLV